MTDLLTEIRARDALKGHSPAGVTMTQAGADRRTLLRLLDATREELVGVTARLDRIAKRHANVLWPNDPNSASCRRCGLANPCPDRRDAEGGPIPDGARA